MDVRVLEGLRIPAALRGLPRPCRRLYLRGALPPDPVPRVAVVGSRSPSPSGEETAYALGRNLARAGVAVVSGLARGIDAAAHRGALDGGGVSVGFLGSGIDVPYPRTSRELIAELPRCGAVLSEYPPGVPPLPWRFVERNRLVAAYTAGTVVVEAGARSGALITAAFALEFGRELWAVPGDPRRPGCRGNNRLLRDGALVALDAADVVAGLGLARIPPEAPESGPAAPPGLSPDEARVWGTLAGDGPGDAEALSRRTGLAVSALLEALSNLELEGHVERDREGYALSGRRGRR